MATKLNKAVHRECRSDVRDGGHVGALVLTIKPEGSQCIIEVRPKGRRKGYSTTVDGLYWMLAKRA